MTATETSSGSAQRSVSPQEWETRVKLAAAYRLAALFHWTDHTATHFSARVPDSGHGVFLINAFGLLFDEITASNLVKVDIDGRILDDPSGLGINQAGYVIHSAIHRARPDLAAVLHTHTRDGVAVACQRDGLLPLSQHALIVYHRLAYHDYEGVALELDEQQRLIADLGDKDLLILRNHGLLSAGVSIEAAFRQLYTLERACTVQIAAQAGGSAQLLLPSTAAIEKVRIQSTRPSATDSAGSTRHWNALIRRLERDGTAYKT